MEERVNIDHIADDLSRAYQDGYNAGYADFPATDVREAKRGKWIDHQEGRWIYAKCSECGTVHDVESNFCPNCGADMRPEPPKEE